VFDFSFNSEIDFESGTDLEIEGNINFAVGFGYNYNNKYSLELRYSTNREILFDYPNLDSAYKNVSIIFGYTIL
jgi:hypothetical protein